jgi:hypothetical protein
MKPSWYLILMCHAMSLCGLTAQIEVSAPGEIQTVFSGNNRTLNVQLSNKSTHIAEDLFSTRLWQISSATRMPATDRIQWKKIQILAGQTILEKLDLNLPDVQNITLFDLAFFDTSTNELGHISIRVCPHNILAQISNQSNGKPPGILDPENAIKPALLQHSILFQDLDDNAGFDNFGGGLAIIGPTGQDKGSFQALSQRVNNALSKKPMNLVWILPTTRREDILPGMWMLRYQSQTVVLVQNSEIANLSTSPASQIHLIQAVSLARHPELLQIPKPEL